MYITYVIVVFFIYKFLSCGRAHMSVKVRTVRFSLGENKALTQKKKVLYDINSAAYGINTSEEGKGANFP